MLQGAKFDPRGDYVRRWVPELQTCRPRPSTPHGRRPGTSSSARGVRLGETYPRPVVDHDTARGQALAALAEIRIPLMHDHRVCVTASHDISRWNRDNVERILILHHCSGAPDVEVVRGYPSEFH